MTETCRLVEGRKQKFLNSPWSPSVEVRRKKQRSSRQERDFPL